MSKDFPSDLKNLNEAQDSAAESGDLSSRGVQRRQHNQDLIRRMRNGEPLWSFDSSASWFPERRKIEKDAKAVKSLYGDAATGLTERRTSKESVEAASKLKAGDTVETGNVVSLRPHGPSGRAS